MRLAVWPLRISVVESIFGSDLELEWLIFVVLTLKNDKHSENNKNNNQNRLHSVGSACWLRRFRGIIEKTEKYHQETKMIDLKTKLNPYIPSR